MKYNDLTFLIPGTVIQLFIYNTNKCTTNKHNNAIHLLPHFLAVLHHLKGVYIPILKLIKI